jgi:hypothetical protein
MPMDKTLFATQADIKLRLDNTIIRWKGRPYYCRNSGESYQLMLYQVANRQEEAIIVDVGDPLLDFSSPPVGFLNHDEYCVYYSRVPHRKYKQGLANDSIEVHLLNGQKTRDYEHQYVSDKKALMFMGSYPSYHYCWDVIHRKPKEVRKISHAFSRNFAIQGGENGCVELYHKMNLIGNYNTDDKYFSLLPTYNVMITKNLLKKLGVPVDAPEYKGL